MKENKNNVICIIGMHRSGTSMIARLLNLCGLDLGPSEQFLPPNEFNPAGYFENEGFVKIDNALLARFGGSWDDPPLFKEGWEYGSSFGQIIREAKLLLGTFSKSVNWGWKDPRTTVLLPFWKLLIPGLRFVICIRSPLEIAKSLAERDRMPIQKGVYLWNQYMRAAIRDTEGCPRIFVFYEDFFKDAPREIGRMVEFCGLLKSDDLYALHDAISHELKNHTSETLELLNEDKVITEYKLFYIGLRALTIDGFLRSASDHTREALISENISKFFKLLEQFHDEQEAARLQSALADKERQAAERICRLERGIRNSENDRDVWRAHAQSLERDRDGWRGHAGNLEKVIADREGHISNLIDHAGNLEGMIADRERRIDDLTEHAGNLEKIIADREGRINNLTEHAGNLERVITDREKHIHNLTEEISNLESSIKERDIQISSLKDFERKVKNTFLYRAHRYLRLHKIYNK